MKKRLSMILERLKKLTFYKKKTFYIILTVLFSLVLLADAAVAVFVPAQTMNFGGRGNGFPQMSDSSEETGDDFANGPSGMPGGGESDGMTMPEKSESGEMTMPEGSESGEMTMPERSESGEMTMPEGSESGEITFPEDMDMSSLRGNSQSEKSFLQTWKSHWLVIFIVFFVLDAASIFMVVFLSKKEKKQLLLENKQRKASGPAASRVGKPVKKESHSHIVGIFALCAMAILVVVIKIMTADNEEEEQTEATVYSSTAELGEISSVVPGTGTLQEETSADLELPADVEITKWYVSNGDTVSEGDVLAQVDPVSVMSAIVEVQENMEALDEKLEEHQNEEIADTITASTDGKVKAVYAENGTGVLDTMYEDGALMLISLDGMMAVSIETEVSLSAGDIVSVTLADDTVLSGKVQSMTNGTAVITVSDDDADYGETVKATTEDGTEVGTGELYIHSELRITGFTGTVSSVEVSVDEEVQSGDTLLSLTDTDYTGEYELLLEQRQELETQMQELFQLYQENYVYATCAGVISGLDESAQADDSGDTENADAESAESSDTDSSENTDTESAQVTTTSYGGSASVKSQTANGGIITTSYGSGSGVKILACSTSSDTVTENEEEIVTASETRTTAQSDLQSEDEVGAESADDSENETGTGAGSENESGTGNGSGSENVPGTGSESGTESGSGSGTGSDTGSENESGSGSGTGSGNESGSGNGTTAAYGNYVGIVTAVENGAEGSVEVSLRLLNSVMGDPAAVNQFSLSSGLTVYTFSSGSCAAGSPSDIQVNDTLMLVYESGTPAFGIRIVSGGSSNTQQGSGSTAGSQNSAGMSGSSGADSTAGMSGSASMGSASGQSQSSGMSGSSAAASLSAEVSAAVITAMEEEIEENYGVTTTTWLSVTPQNSMEITVSIDEMDILSLEEDQNALVTLDAFPGQSFDGTVTEINLSGVNSGGSSKYEAVIRIDRMENMLAGMNASVSIEVETKDNILLIPVDALEEDESGVYVYTSYDEKTETFGDPVQVTTGISDGENVEIVSGLSEGSEFWYSCLDVVNYTTSYSGNGGGFSTESMFGGQSGGKSR